MSFEIKVRHHTVVSPLDPTGSGGTVVAEYSGVLSLVKEYVLSAIIAKIADKFVEEHYAEIEKQLDIKVIAAASSARMGAIVEERLQEEIKRIQYVADEALRKAKKR